MACVRIAVKPRSDPAFSVGFAGYSTNAYVTTPAIQFRNYFSGLLGKH